MEKVKIKVTYHFYLHHTPTKTLIERLSWTQLNAICRTLRTSEWNDWKIWVAEINLWFELTDLVQEILSRSDGLFRKPPAPPKAKDGHTLEHQLLDVPTDNRQHVRYNIKLPIMIDIVGSLINTFTTDISSGGMRLENEIPLRKEINHCFVYYRSGDDLIEFKAKPFYEMSEKLCFNRLQLISCSKIDLWKMVLRRAARDSDK